MKGDPTMKYFVYVFGGEWDGKRIYRPFETLDDATKYAKDFFKRHSDTLGELWNRIAIFDENDEQVAEY